MDIMPPLEMRSPETVYVVFYVLFAVQLVGALIFLGLRAHAKRTVLPLAALAGATVIGYFAAPLFNHLTLVWFPSNIPFPFTDAFGMEDPSFDWAGYALFFGLGGYLTYERIAAGDGARAMLAIAAAWGIADLLYEIPFLQLDMYQYYGDQPLEVGGFPLYWVVMNSAVPLITGAAMHAFVVNASSARAAAWGAAAAPVLAAMLLILPILPVSATLNADVPTLVRWAGAFLSMAIAASAIAFVARYAANVAPRREDSTGAPARELAGAR